MKKTELIAFRVDAATKAALEDLARLDERSLSQYISIVLRKHIETKARKTK